MFINIEEIKNTLREFQAENGWKFKNTQAEFKKVVSYKKKKVYLIVVYSYSVPRYTSCVNKQHI